jgi:hypothetical protein
VRFTTITVLKTNYKIDTVLGAVETEENRKTSMISSTFLSTDACGKLVDNSFSVKNFTKVQNIHIYPQTSFAVCSGNVENIFSNICKQRV